MTATAVHKLPASREPYSYRSDPSVPAFPDDRPIVIFDGLCALCTGWARFVLRFDRSGRFRLLPAQSTLGRALYVHYGLDPEVYETSILIEDGRAWLKSEGAIRVATGLGALWSWVKMLRILPLAPRDRAYDWIARNRFRLMGRREACYMPTPSQKERFLKRFLA
jgi:predicted DCC family thiol-disulfide oxidoreductase YuxK